MQVFGSGSTAEILVPGAHNVGLYTESRGKSTKENRETPTRFDLVVYSRRFSFFFPTFYLTFHRKKQQFALGTGICSDGTSTLFFSSCSI